MTRDNANFNDLAARLPFGRRHALHSGSTDDMCRVVGRAMTGEWDISNLEPTTPFNHVSTALDLGGVTLASTASTPVLVRREPLPYATLFMPWRGSCNFEVGMQRFGGKALAQAVLMSGRTRIARTDADYVGVQLPVQPQRLQQVARAMSGHDADDAPLDFELGRDRELSLHVGNVALDRVFIGLCEGIRAIEPQHHALLAMQYGDTFYRLLALMLRPEALLVEDPKHSPHGARRSLDALRDHIYDHADEPLTLSDLERFSGMSRRALQYAFQQRYDCTPMEWVRQARLARAHARLRAGGGASVTDIALSSGFSNLAAFAASYRRRYGEPPSVTLRRARGGKDGDTRQDGDTRKDRDA